MNKQGWGARPWGWAGPESRGKTELPAWTRERATQPAPGPRKPRALSEKRDRKAWLYLYLWARPELPRGSSRTDTGTHGQHPVGRATLPASLPPTPRAHLGKAKCRLLLLSLNTMWL